MPGFLNTSFHGWRVVAFSAVSQFIAMGFSIYLLGIYIEPMSATFEVSPGVFGWGMGFFYLINSLSGPFVGAWVDRGHVRKVLVVGAVMFALSFVVMASSTNIWQVAVACIFLLAPGSCMIGVLPCAAMLVNWFHERQAFALGVAALGISFGGFLMPPLASQLIAELGWRQSMLVLAAVIATVLLPLVWALAVGKASDVGQNADGVETKAHRDQPSAGEADLSMKALILQSSFWFLTLSVGLLTLCSILLITFIVPMARERGVAAGSSALLLSAYAGSSLVGKFVLGWLGDQYSRRKVFISIQTMATLGWLPMLWLDGVAGLMISVVSVGLAVGGMTPLWAALIAQYFGRQSFGRVKGLMTLAMLVCTVIPGPLGGGIYDLYGSYTSSFSLIWWALPFALTCTTLLPEGKATP